MSMSLTERLQALYKADELLIAQGRLVRTTMLIEAGSQGAIITILDGAVTDIADRAQLVMPSWAFALRASEPEWKQFWEPVPRPGHHDLFALLRRGELVIEGDIHPFMGNLLYFKTLLALPRTV